MASVMPWGLVVVRVVGQVVGSGVLGLATALVVSVSLVVVVGMVMGGQCLTFRFRVR